MFRIYVAGGVTSNLFSALLPSFVESGHMIWATVREPDEKNREIHMLRVKTLTDMGVKMITKEEGLKLPFDAVLWLSTHDDFDFLAQLTAKEMPTCAISSGAIMDYYLGSETEEQLNEYKRSKLTLSRIPNIVTLIPGFYIEDIPTPQWASKGLHGKTTVNLFSNDPEASFDWNRMYSVTPKSTLVMIINEWLSHPETFPRNQPIIACTDRQYRRWELRQLSGLGVPANVLAPQTDNIYSKFPHAVKSDSTSIIITHDQIETACVNARKIQ